MLKVTFPKTKVPVIKRLNNLIKMKGDILTPKERSYADFLTREIRENVVPWAEESEINTAAISNIRKEFIDKVRKEEPKKYKKIVQNVEDYVYKEAQYHFDKMSDPFVQSMLTNVCPTSANVVKNGMKRDECFKKIEEIYGAPLNLDEGWEAIETKLREKNLNYKKRSLCKFLYNKAYQYDVQRIDNIIQMENQLAANEAAAKKYGLWKSYNYVYNLPQ